MIRRLLNRLHSSRTKLEPEHLQAAPTHLCRDCKYVIEDRYGNWSFAQCKVVFFVDDDNLISGTVTKRQAHCSYARSIGECGPSARLWVAK